jgi:hypothetical protein
MNAGLQLLPQLVVVLMMMLVLGHFHTHTMAQQSTKYCVSPDGGFNLTSLNTGHDLYYTADATDSYTLSICSITQNGACAAQNGSLCVSTTVPATIQEVLAVWDGTGQWSNCTDPVQCPCMSRCVCVCVAFLFLSSSVFDVLAILCVGSGWCNHIVCKRCRMWW